MSEYLRFCLFSAPLKELPNYIRCDLKLFKINKERQETHCSKKQGDQWKILNQNKEVVAIFASEEDSETFFYDEHPIENITTHLRDPILLDEGVTFSKIMHALKKYSIEKLFPEYPSCPSSALGDEADYEPAKVAIVHETGTLEDGVFSSNFELGFENNRNFDASTVVETDCNYSLILDGQVKEYNKPITLIELLFALYGKKGNCHFAFSNNIDSWLLFSGDKEINPLEALFYECDIQHDDITLLDIFHYVQSRPELKEFIKEYSWCRAIDDFHAIAEHPSDAENPLWHLEITKHVTIDHGIYNFLDIDMSFSGIGDHPKDAPETTRNHTVYGLSATPINQISRLPLVFCKDMEICIYENENRKAKFEEIKKCETTFTLLEILDAIYWEISFFGGPEVDVEIKEQMSTQLNDFLKVNPNMVIQTLQKEPENLDLEKK